MLNYTNILKGNDIHVHKLCIYWHNAHGQLGTGAHQSASKLHHPVLRSRSRKLQVQHVFPGWHQFCSVLSHCCFSDRNGTCLLKTTPIILNGSHMDGGLVGV